MTDLEREVRNLVWDYVADFEECNDSETEGLLVEGLTQRIVALAKKHADPRPPTLPDPGFAYND